MEKIHRYLECHVPVTTCNLRCHYCYITLNGHFKNKPGKIPISPDSLRNCLSMGRMGGTCLINLCASGETLMLPGFVEYVKALLEEGHFLSIVTNGTLSDRFDSLISLNKKLLERVFFKFSYQYLELIKRGWLERFFDNIAKIREAGSSFTLEVTPSDELIPHIGDLINLALKYCGNKPHVTVARDSRSKELPILTFLSRDEYFDVWNSAFDSNLFRYKMSIFGEKRAEFCYAGSWSYYLRLGTGDLSQCYFGGFIQNIFSNPAEPILSKPVGFHCPEPHCYNGHSWITLGDIPVLSAPTYFQLRNRICPDGSEWIQEPVRSFFSSKLYETQTKINILKMLKYRCNNNISKLKNRLIPIKTG